MGLYKWLFGEWKTIGRTKAIAHYTGLAVRWGGASKGEVLIVLQRNTKSGRRRAFIIECDGTQHDIAVHVAVDLVRAAAAEENEWDDGEESSESEDY